MSSAKWRLFCLGLNVLTQFYVAIYWQGYSTKLKMKSIIHWMHLIKVTHNVKKRLHLLKWKGIYMLGLLVMGMLYHFGQFLIIRGQSHNTQIHEIDPKELQFPIWVTFPIFVNHQSIYVVIIFIRNYNLGMMLKMMKMNRLDM